MADTEPFRETSFADMMKPRKPGQSYAELVAAIDAGKTLHIKHFLNCGAGYFFAVAKRAVLDSVIDVIFQRERAEHESWDRRVEEAAATGSYYCDGLIFGVTRGLLADAIEKATPEARYDYVREFKFACAGTFITVEDASKEVETLYGPLSDYQARQFGLRE